MNTLKDKNQISEQHGLVINDKLKEQFGPSPLFPKKVEKAVAIMTLVRERQQHKKSS